HGLRPSFLHTGVEEMKSLQEAFQKQLNEATEKAEKQQATINFLKTEMERKSKMIRDLQNEVRGTFDCHLHSEFTLKKIMTLHEKLWGKNAQQLTDLEQKLAVAKDELEKAALDKESQLKALKETVQLCLSSVLHNQPPATKLIPSKPAEKLTSPLTKGSKVAFQVTSTKCLLEMIFNTRTCCRKFILKIYFLVRYFGLSGECDIKKHKLGFKTQCKSVDKSA
uniref:Leucine zipper protein 2 n=1 Tax=Calidris pygmaea TaxID=425635 RepID=A0A8C3K371_9CHAR